MLKINKLISNNICRFKNNNSNNGLVGGLNRFYSKSSDSDNYHMTPEDLIVNQVKNSASPMVKVCGSDVDGILRGKYLQKEKFTSSVKKGFGFCSVIFGWDSNDVTYDNVKFTGNHTGYPDITAKVDLSSYRQVPWENNIPFFLIDFYKNSGEPLPICPRNLLKKVIADCRAEQLEPMMGMEFEWYNYAETNKSIQQKNFTKPTPLTPGMFGYSMIRISENSRYMEDLANLKHYGIPLEGLHTETGPGVYEVAIQFSEALEAADRAILFKLSAKEIAAKLGIMASFMAKPSVDLPGCSGHMHQNFATLDKSVNLFIDKDNPDEMSPMFKSFIAGQLELLPEFLPFFAPTINSYKRLVDGYWAPTTPTWSYDNRTVAIRVIKGGKAMRSEFRVTGSDVNPYIAIAASFAAGLYGVKNKLELKSKPVIGNSYDLYKQGLVTRLPRTLSESTELLAKSKIAKEILGEEFVDHFVNTRRWEYRQFNHQVHRWEHERYFEII
ncbi:glutamine synthetase type I [Heterostelium album PN500]|uniref:Glutamine synthetase type I n=1 Tax=Heterostelium pallidum (strain ATCC 26659 / Pp 5 / PN500) TaxID=670386 RepID=D3BM59_HETP5|nr:glutamine synthetase type I [Heterostelium album PN500]EFA77660.1 glutamine synthetase type I [Heterostelium album PN500]|eukprot:XP_020429788.1 glutamine synthetase type I [Heterostelium album PN500]